MKNQCMCISLLILVVGFALYYSSKKHNDAIFSFPRWGQANVEEMYTQLESESGQRALSPYSGCTVNTRKNYQNNYLNLPVNIGTAEHPNQVNIDSTVGLGPGLMGRSRFLGEGAFGLRG